MPPDEKQNINLLPGDWQRKRQVIKKVISERDIVYTDTANDGEAAKKRPAPPVLSRTGEKVRLASSPNSVTSAAPAAKPPEPPPAPPPVAGPSPASPTPPPPIKDVPPQVPRSVSPAPQMRDRDGAGLDVNLLSGEYAEVFVAKNQKRIFIIAVILTVFALLLAYGVISLYQIKKAASTRATAQITTELEKTIATYSDLEAEDRNLQQKIGVLKVLLDRHLSLKSFLARLEESTIPEITYTAVAASREGAVVLSALATDYTALARQLAIWQKNTSWALAADVTSAALARDNQAKSRGVEFDAILKVDPAVFSEAKD